MKSPLHVVERGFGGGANINIPHIITLPISMILTYLPTPEPCMERGFSNPQFAIRNSQSAIPPFPRSAALSGGF